MFQFLRGIVLIAAMILNCGAAFAVDVNSANYIMPGCRAYLLPKIINEFFLAGVCSGLVDGMGYGANICSPEGVTNEQAVRVVVRYIAERPARLHENFKALALEALTAAWPCKK